MFNEYYHYWHFISCRVMKEIQNNTVSSFVNKYHLGCETESCIKGWLIGNVQSMGYSVCNDHLHATHEISRWIYMVFDIGERNLSRVLSIVKTKYLFSSTIEIMWYHGNILR
jgi:hypothetical protein